MLGQEYLEPPNWSQFIREYCPELECHVQGANVCNFGIKGKKLNELFRSTLATKLVCHVENE